MYDNDSYLHGLFVVIGLVYANVISLRELDIASDVCIIIVSDTDGVNSSVIVVGDCDASSVVANPIMSSSIVSDVSLNAASVMTASGKEIKLKF